MCRTIPFPAQQAAKPSIAASRSRSNKSNTAGTNASSEHARNVTPAFEGAPESTDEVLEAFATVSRRINDLARELKCLGYFDEDHDRPRAA